MFIYVLVFVLNAMYVASVIGRFRVVEVDETEATRAAPTLDAIMIALLVVNGVLCAMHWQGQEPSLAFSGIVWLTTGWIAIRRTDQDLAALKARTSKGEQS